MNHNQTLEWNLRALRALVDAEARRLDTERRHYRLDAKDVIGLVKQRNNYVRDELDRIVARLKDVNNIPEALIDNILKEEVA
jgi:hypothetical protein